MVHRLYVEKRPAFALQAEALLKAIHAFLGIQSLTHVRLLNRYDVENVPFEAFVRSKNTVFAEPQTDDVYDVLPFSEGECTILAVEYLPGQFDQRADSAAQCIQLMFQQDRPLVRNARIYALFGALTKEELAMIRAYLINPVDSQEASLALPATLKSAYPPPGAVPVLDGFLSLSDEGLFAFLQAQGLAMDIDDLRFCQAYFRAENRSPTQTELQVIDTYWSDHCRHTTFLTNLTDVTFEHPAAQAAYARYLSIREALGIQKPVSLMDIGTIAAKYLKSKGKLANIDESEEINACTVRVNVQLNDGCEPYLLLFKNETHNHPTEIEPFGGAATCIGGAIRDPLSGRAYVYQAMRVTGAGDPRLPREATRPGKLPQRKIVTESAAGYSSYGNQIGLATGLVDELYHEGYTAKRLEIGAVVGAAPQANVRRKKPAPGDHILLLGGRTGRDGCGGATGSSKTHTLSSLEECAAEVQKGNAPEERKLQRLFRNPDAARMIKRCNDFGAGGVSVAIGELADGLFIDLDAIPKKYEGLSGTELAISESQERMAVVIAPKDMEAFMQLAAQENLEASLVATVTDTSRLQMHFGGATIVDIAREFLNSNGAPKHATATIEPPKTPLYPFRQQDVSQRLHALITDLNVCSKRGLIERFDSTIGAGSLLMPLGGVKQRTPAQAMAAKLPVLSQPTNTCSFMAYGYNPLWSEADPFGGAYLAVVESVAKLVSSGAPLDQCYLTFQEYFARLRQEPARWGQPLSALLGALEAQLALGIAAIGGKDSMSGSFEELDVPPTLVSFAVAIGDARYVASPEFKRTDTRIALLKPTLNDFGLPDAQSLLSIWETARTLLSSGRALSAYTPGYGGIMEGLFKMCLGNQIGCILQAPADELFAYCYGGLILEVLQEETAGITLGFTSSSYTLTIANTCFALSTLEAAYEQPLEGVYPTQPAARTGLVAPAIYRHIVRSDARPIKRTAMPRVLIPVFPGTNCEFDSAAAFQKTGAKTEIFVIRNRSAAEITQSAMQFALALHSSQILFLPGGFSGGDEPDGSAKFITAFLRNARIAEEIGNLLEQRDGLIGGICNGFQALIKLGLLPFGQMRELGASSPTLTFNTIGRHQSRLVRTRVASVLSPWLSQCEIDDTYLVPVSHGEGQFVCDPLLLSALEKKGQIATQYVNTDGKPTMAVQHNPNGSVQAIEGITSPDGRIFGKMGHSERVGAHLYKNVPGNTYMPIFESAVSYFK